MLFKITSHSRLTSEGIVIDYLHKDYIEDLEEMFSNGLIDIQGDFGDNPDNCIIWIERAEYLVDISNKVKSPVKIRSGILEICSDKIH